MTLEIGYHVMTPEATDEHGRFDEELSVIEFLRLVEQREVLPLDVTVQGLDRYLEVADDPHEAAEFIHTILRDRVNFVLNQSPVVQFVVNDIEHWDGPVLPVNDSEIRLVNVFGGSFEQEGPGWYAGEFNVQS